MDLYELINEIGETKEGYNRYFSSSKRASILFSSIFSTNTRTVIAYYDYIEKFSENIGVERKKWVKLAKSNQEKSKQQVVPLTAAELIYKDENGLYNYTEKSKILNYINEKDLTKFERLVVNSLFLCNYKSINLKSLIEEVEDFKQTMEMLDYKVDQIIEDSIIAIKESYNINKLFLYMVFFREGLEDLPNILSIIHNSSEKDIKNLDLIIEKEIKNKEYKSILSKRLRPNGNLSKTTIENMYIVLILILNINNSNGDYEEIIINILKPFERIEGFSKEKIISYLKDNNVKNVLVKVLEDVNEDLEIKVSYKHNQTKQIDTTTKTSKISNEEIFYSLKRTILEKSNYTCKLDLLRNCKKQYFTSKSTSRTYLEVHHFLPRKYSAFIKSGVEFPENYIPLCPSCHRMIHMATDNERKVILNYILNSNQEINNILKDSEIGSCKNNYEKIEVLYDFK